METKAQELRKLKLRQLATLQAALRYWQREGLLSAGTEQDMATANGQFDALSIAEIDQLCAALHIEEVPQPTAVVELKGGCVQDVVMSQAMRVIVLDFDTEGTERLTCLVQGEPALVTNYDATRPGNFVTVAPEKVLGVLDAIEAAYPEMQWIR